MKQHPWNKCQKHIMGRGHGHCAPSDPINPHPSCRDCRRHRWKKNNQTGLEEGRGIGQRDDSLRESHTQSPNQRGIDKIHEWGHRTTQQAIEHTTLSMPAEGQGVIARVHPSVSIDAQCSAATEHTVCTDCACRTEPRLEYLHTVPWHGFVVCNTPWPQATKSHPICLSHAGGLLEELQQEAEKRHRSASMG